MLRPNSVEPLAPKKQVSMAWSLPYGSTMTKDVRAILKMKASGIPASNGSSIKTPSGVWNSLQRKRTVQGDDGCWGLRNENNRGLE